MYFFRFFVSTRFVVCAACVSMCMRRSVTFHSNDCSSTAWRNAAFFSSSWPRSKGPFTPDAAPQRNATQRTAFSVNTQLIQRIHYYCVARRRSSRTRRISWECSHWMRRVALRCGAVRCGIRYKRTSSVVANRVTLRPIRTTRKYGSHIWPVHTGALFDTRTYGRIVRAVNTARTIRAVFTVSALVRIGL